MSTDLHASRAELGLSNVSSGSTNNAQSSSTNPSSNAMNSHTEANFNAPPSFPKPLALSPRTFGGMEDFRDFCGPLSFKTGLTPRVFSTGLTPRSGFTPHYNTGLTPRLGHDTSSFFNRTTGLSPPRPHEMGNKISPTGFTPKDITGLKMRFPGTMGGQSPKIGMHMSESMYAPAQAKHHTVQHTSQPYGHAHGSYSHHTMPPNEDHHHQHQHHAHAQSHHPSLQHNQGINGNIATHQNEMNPMNMGMYDYMQNRSNVSHSIPNEHRRTGHSPTSNPASDTEDVDERRRMKNRERVRKCRKRKQDRLNYLEDRTSELERENGLLKGKLARTTSPSIKIDTMTEDQLKDLRKKQNTTINAYVRASNEADGMYETMAYELYCDNAEIIYANDDSIVSGIQEIIANKKSTRTIFQSYKIKQYTVHWKPQMHTKCKVVWDIEMEILPSITKEENLHIVPLTKPFSALARIITKKETIHCPMVSYLTFQDDKIQEEIRHIDISNLIHTLSTNYTNDMEQYKKLLSLMM